MPAPRGLADRPAFAERIRLQLTSRYRGVAVEFPPVRFALHVTAPGIDSTLPLSPLHHACIREPERAPVLITEYVGSVDRQLPPGTGTGLPTRRPRWGPSMRGVPREAGAALGSSDDEIRAIASANTEARFSALVQRIRTIERIPADGWRMAGDVLYQGSILMAPEVLAALVERSAGDVLVATPDRGVVLAIHASQPKAERFHRRVLREWREAMNPCSHEVLRTDGVHVSSVPRPRPRAGALVLPWLGE